VAEVWPTLVDFLFNDGRFAAQVLLVIGGFLAAQSLPRQPLARPLAVIGRRYLRLAPPFLAAMLLVSAVVWGLRPAIGADWLTQAPTWGSAAAHLLMLHELLGVPSLSVGVWYVAIDFQLYALLALLAWSLRSASALASNRMLVMATALITLASLGWFNRFSDLDSLPVYFFGVYGLGVLAAWARQSRFAAKVFMGVLLGGLIAYWVMPRERVGLAMLTAVIIFWGAGWRLHAPRLSGVLKRLGDSAYALFLTHFAMIVVASALWLQLELDGPMAAIALSAATWAGSLALGDRFHQWVERPLQRIIVARGRASEDPRAYA